MNNITAFKTYKADFHCRNCNSISTYEVPWGTLMAIHAKEKGCTKCGVKSEQVKEYFDNEKKVVEPSELLELSLAIKALARAIEGKN